MALSTGPGLEIKFGSASLGGGPKPSAAAGATVGGGVPAGTDCAASAA